MARTEFRERPTCAFSGLPKAGPLEGGVGQAAFGRFEGERTNLPRTRDLTRRVAAYEHRARQRANTDGGGAEQANGSLAAEGQTARDDLGEIAVAQSKRFPGHWWPAAPTLATSLFAVHDD